VANDPTLKLSNRLYLKTSSTAAQDRKGLTKVVVECNTKLSFLFQCFKRRKICVMLQCFPALIISKFKLVILAAQDTFKHGYRQILVLYMKRILFFTNGLNWIIVTTSFLFCAWSIFYFVRIDVYQYVQFNSRCMHETDSFSWTVSLND
jgi:hypothetical protein